MGHTWSYTTRMGITGWWLGVDGRGDFPSPGYYSNARDLHDNGPPGTPWHTTGLYPEASPYFDDFFYNESEFQAELAGGLAMIAEAEHAAATESSADSNPNNRPRAYAAKLITTFQSYIGDGLYAFYGYVIIDPVGGASPSIGTPGFAPPEPVPPNGPIHGTNPPPQLPPPNGPPPPPPTKPPGVPIPGPPSTNFSMKYPCINDDGTMTEVEDPADCPPITPLQDAIDDFGGDIIEIPQDETTGQLVTWQPVFPAGIDRPNAIFAWDRAPRNLNTLDLLDDGQQTINQLVATGAQVDGINLTVTVTDQDSVDAIGRYWASENFSFATDIATLTSMANARLRKYRMGAHVVSFEPAPGTKSLPKPWADFDISDTVRVRASSALRGGFDPTVTGIFGHTLDVQRVNGWDLELDDETDAEKLTKLYTEEDVG